MRWLISCSKPGLAGLLALVVALALPATATAASTFYIRGAGYGHGVGMSQYGAYGYALHGKDYRYILAHYYQGTTLGVTNPRRIVRVLLETGPASFRGASRAGAWKLKPGMSYSVRALAGGRLALYNAKDHRIGTFRAPLTVTGRGPLTVAGLGSYRGALQFRPDGAGGVQTINALGLDEYLRGVVASEMPPSWPAQALDAQAIAARTYAITSDVGGSAYQLYSDTRSQAYGGVAAETPASDAAVGATAGQIVTYRGAPATTYFFSSSGGRTEDVQNAFLGASPEPWLRGVPDPYDDAEGANPYHRWSLRMSVASAEAKLAGLVKGSLVGIRVLRHGVSPRIITAAVLGTRGWTLVSGPQLQQRFGLLSTWARFQLITASAGAATRALPRPPTASDLDPARLTGRTAAAMSQFIGQLFANPIPALHGRVFPGRAGSPLLVQRLEQGGRWQTVRRARLGAGGRYLVKLPGAGTYRVVYDGFVGPTVGVA